MTNVLNFSHKFQTRNQTFLQETWLLLVLIWYFKGFPGGRVVRIHLQCRRYKRHRFDLWLGKIPWRKKWQATPVFLPGKSQRSLVGYSPWGSRVWHYWATEHTGMQWCVFFFFLTFIISF